MNRFDRMLRADFLKIKRTPLLLIHLLLPLIGAGAFLAYASISPMDGLLLTVGFVEILAVAFPTLIGVLTAMLARQEEAAGQFQNLLGGAAPKMWTFLSKLFLLLIMGFTGTLLAVVMFGAGLTELLHKDGLLPMHLYLTVACVLAGSCIILYIFHLMISLRFGQGTSIGMGIMGSLLGALLLTGLGDGIWILVPWSWPVRLASMWVLYATEVPLSSSIMVQLHSGIWISIIVTAGVLLLSCVWFTRWEGRKSEG
ncbi:MULTISPECIES: lantibiotic immunity ABC transporter MutG family permease subunit [unclassified Paenibacillus]|uniref:lantibiotic immunity ABC transporter MutG family permease subunit n=1 Tax=unclassified Paenibacillus TaxID=185978 RepID=UPI0036CF8F9C